jgi:hypothetical protein
MNHINSIGLLYFIKKYQYYKNYKHPKISLFILFYTVVDVGNLNIDVRVNLGYFHNNIGGWLFRKYNTSNGYDTD